MHNILKRLHSVFKESEVPFYRYDKTVHTYADAYDLMRCQNALLSQYNASRVLVIAGKSFEVYCAVFSILFSGNCWLPISSATPLQRVSRILDVAQPDLVLIDDSVPEEIKRLLVERSVNFSSLDDLRGPNTVQKEFSNLPKDMNQDAIIYFTSGSTGEPKGVRITHANYTVVVQNILDMLPLKSGEVFGDYHDLGFVISVPILFPCVLTESTVSPSRNEAEAFMPIEHLKRNDVSVLITVPSTIARIRQSRRLSKGDIDLNVLISCGEPLHLDVLRYALDEIQPDHTFNFYGSTEVSPWIFSHTCSRSDLERYSAIGYVPIGTPMQDNDILLKEDTDELWVSGPKITPGYLNGESSEKFIERDGKRWFRMGDIVVRDEDGTYICKGRIDSQVKISGYRVDLLGIEAQLRMIDGVENGICFAAGSDAEKYLVVVLQTIENYTVAELRAILSDKLPKYMLPRKVICKNELPFNKSGKIDRAVLKKIY